MTAAYVQVRVAVMLTIIVAVAVAIGCGQHPEQQPLPPPGITLTHVDRSGPLPYSQNDALAMMTPERACMLDSYDVAIVCGDRSWQDVERYGRSGRGPGELSAAGFLVSDTDSAIALLDPVNRRVIRLQDDMRAVEASLDDRITPASDMVNGVVLGYAPPGAGGWQDVPIARLRILNVETGSVVSTKSLVIPSHELGGTEAAITGLVLLRSGRYIARVEGERLRRWALFTAGGHFAALLDEPPFRPGRPTARDVEVFQEQYRIALMGAPMPDSTLRNFRSRPLRPYQRGMVYRHVQEDPQGNLWILTNRRTAEATWVDVYRGAAYHGSIAIHGRVSALQIRGSVVLALTESVSDAAPVATRWLDWYDLRFP